MVALILQMLSMKPVQKKRAQQDDAITIPVKTLNNQKLCGKIEENMASMLVSYSNLRKGTVSSLAHTDVFRLSYGSFSGYFSHVS